MPLGSELVFTTLLTRTWYTYFVRVRCGMDVLGQYQYLDYYANTSGNLRRFRLFLCVEFRKKHVTSLM